MNLWFSPRGHYDGKFPEDNSYQTFTSPQDASLTPLCSGSNWVGSWPDDTDIMPINVIDGFTTHAAGKFMGRYTIDRHNFMVNVSMNDGSTRSVPITDLWSLKWHQTFVPR